jgi:hypothetical protein
MHRSRRRLASTAVATALALAPALGACSEKDPGSLPTPPSSESPSPPLTESTTPSSATSSPSSPSPSPPSAEPSAKPTPEQPPVSREDTQAGAVAFGRYYIDVINHAAATGETRALTRLSLSACGSCRSLVGTVKNIYGAGGYIHGGSLEVRWHSSVENPQDDSWSLVLGIRTGPQEVKPSKGAAVERQPSERARFSMLVARRHSNWRIEELTRQ